MTKHLFFNKFKYKVYFLDQQKPIVSEQPVTSDVNTELLFNKDVPNEFLEVILEGAFDETQVSVKESKTQLPSEVQKVEPVSDKVEEESLKTISDYQIELLFSLPEHTIEIEAILEGAFEEIEFNAKEKIPSESQRPEVSIVEDLAEPSIAETPTISEEKPLVNDAQIELLFSKQQESIELEVVLQNGFDEVQFSASEVKDKPSSVEIQQPGNTDSIFV